MTENLFRKDWFQAFILAVVFFSTEFLGSKYISFISIRNLVVLGMIGFIGLTYKQPLTYYRMAAIKTLSIYYLFVIGLGFFNGLFDSVGTTMVFARFFPTIVIAYFLIYYIKKESILKWFLYFLIGILCLDAVATILQGLNHPIGWQIALIFEDMERVMADTERMDREGGSTMGMSIASGFFATVVANGYYLASYGMLFLLPSYWNRTIKGRLMSIVLFALVLSALFYCQQRMAFYSFLLFAPLAFVYLSIKKRNNFTMILAVVALIYVIIMALSEMNIGRLANTTDSLRQAKHALFWNEFFPDNFMLGNRTLFVNMYHSTPHSMFIETILLGGIGGLIIYGIFLLRLIVNYYKAHFHSRSLLLTLLGLPVILFISVSLQHSTGYHTGSTLGMYLLMIFIISQHFIDFPPEEEEEENEKEGEDIQ